MQAQTTSPYKVFFDMDGTLLDLAFDSYIWLDRLPHLWAEQQHISVQQAKQDLYQFYLQHQGTLNWYSTQFWQAQLGIDVLQLQMDFKQLIQPRAGCFELLNSLHTKNIECWLVTNADRYTLALKLQTLPLQPYFTHIISSDIIGYPKEHPQFWHNIHQQYGFSHPHTYLLDDNYDVLNTAQDFGIQHVFSIEQPDSQTPRQQKQEQFIHLQQLTDFLNFLD